MRLSREQISEISKKISKREILILLANIVKRKSSELFFEKEFFLTDAEYDLFTSFIKRRENHEPIAKIIEKREFYGFEFKTSSETLDPRPETELLVDLFQKYFPDKNAALKILDLGTGTGCIGLSLLKLYRNAKADLTDISDGALDVAKFNAAKLKLNHRANFIKSDWFQNVFQKYDAIVSNPPYICDNFQLDFETSYDPKAALFAGKDGLDAYKKILPNASKFLRDHGLLFVEIGFDQSETILTIQSDLEFVELQNDLAKLPRTVVFENKPAIAPNTI